MKVLVTAASTQGSNDPVADKIYTTLQRNGIDARYLHPQDVQMVGGFDAVVIGSAIHNGRWLDPAIRLVERHASELRERKVWLFSSGSLDEAAAARPHSLDLTRLKARTGAVEHRVFRGGMGGEFLAFAEAAAVAPLVKPLDAAYDYDTNQIHRWAAGIARTLRAESRRLDEGLTV